MHSKTSLTISDLSNWRVMIRDCQNIFKKKNYTPNILKAFAKYAQKVNEIIILTSCDEDIIVYVLGSLCNCMHSSASVVH
ncbi:hypothetical protein BpHYR1_050705 [Brachionus plicatilis]|uniref:Uncharacterized protein n=1 Tax=Brachionus plicatilis TaxID=10195 RepID=A0A3M7SQG8_BRAPC|nr:hypothetical protein BpHYR1_050705 [Brachionus plicatilis]